MLPRAASSGIGCGSLMAMVDACPEEKARDPPAHRGSCRDKLPWPCAKELPDAVWNGQVITKWTQDGCYVSLGDAC